MKDQGDSRRNLNGESSVYKGKDGYWHGRVTVGVHDDGKSDRRHVMSRSRAEVVRKVKELEKRRELGRVPEPGQRWTVGQWLDHWLQDIARPSVRENTYLGYAVDVRVHLKPRIGAHRLDRLQPEHLERLYRAMRQEGKAAATAHHVHRTVRTALGEAERRAYLMRNPATIARAPRLEENEPDPLTVEEIRRILKCASVGRNGARWALALALGLRQGEALGLKWTDLDLTRASLTVRRGRLRPRWEHGCGGTCGRRYGGHCPDRKPLRKETAETKSRAGRRTIGLPEQLVELLRTHREQQDVERDRAGVLWTEGEWLFATERGIPLNPRTDYTQWKNLLDTAGVRDMPLHGARHTAATVLLLLGVPDRAVMGLMGWTKAEMTNRYQHLTQEIRCDIAGQVGDLLWGPSPSVTPASEGQRSVPSHGEGN